jgi:hypothetical protein
LTFLFVLDILHSIQRKEKEEAKMSWTEIEPQVMEEALTYAKGDYQRQIIEGKQAISGSTLKGDAKKWSMKYRKSAEAVLSRLCQNGFKVYEKIGNNNSRILVIEKKEEQNHA